MLRKCPNPEKLMEYVTIPSEISRVKLWQTKAHLWRCGKCHERIQQIRETWDGYFTPQPDITPSLLRVYSRLQNDETLILKGWKLGESRRSLSPWATLMKDGWLFRGAVSLGIGAIAGIIFYTEVMNDRGPTAPKLASITPPLAQIRLQDKNKLQVHYLRPELVQSIEFETTRESR